MKGANTKNFSLISTAILISALAAPQIAAAQGQQAAEEPMEMGFFVTSVGVGDGGNLVDFRARMHIARRWLRKQDPKIEPGERT